jgi:hypothetical protein
MVPMPVTRLLEMICWVGNTEVLVGGAPHNNKVVMVDLVVSEGISSKLFFVSMSAASLYSSSAAVERYSFTKLDVPQSYIN